MTQTSCGKEIRGTVRTELLARNSQSLSSKDSHTYAIPRPAGRSGIGYAGVQSGRTLLGHFPSGSCPSVRKVGILNWNAGNLHRNSSLVDAICGNWSLALLQEASTTVGQGKAKERGTSRVLFIICML